MSAPPINPSQSTLLVAWQSTTRVAVGGSEQGDDRDSSKIQATSVTISQQGIALLQLQQSGKPHGGHHHHREYQVTDAQAARIGSKIQEQNEALFKQLDQDGDGKLSASELKAGMEKLREQAKSLATSTTPETPISETIEAELDAIRKAFKDILGGGKPGQQVQEAHASDR